MFTLYTLCVFALIGETIAHEFVGKWKWSDDYIEQCDNKEMDKSWQNKDSICTSYVHKFREVHLEVLSWSPALVIYRDFLTKKQVSNIKETISRKTLEKQSVQDETSVAMQSEVRQANGSFIAHYEDSVSIDLFETVKRLIPGIEFKSSEHFSVLSYHPGGHYVPHYDYLGYKSKDLYDWWMNTYRNRVATLIYVIKTAEKGGGTVFPKIRRTVRANSGDAFLWFNTRSDESQEMLSLHGGCPVYSGEKIVTTHWIRAKGQKILPLADTDQPISAEWLIPGFVEKIRSEIKNQCFEGE